MNNKFESPEVDITFYFKTGERTAEFDDLVLEITGLVNDRRKQRLVQEKKKESQNDDKK